MKKIRDKLPKSNQSLIEIALRTGIMLLMAGVAAAVPDLEPFISLVGAVFFSTLGRSLQTELRLKSLNTF